LPKKIEQGSNHFIRGSKRTIDDQSLNNYSIKNPEYEISPLSGYKLSKKYLKMMAGQKTLPIPYPPRFESRNKKKPPGMEQVPLQIPYSVFLTKFYSQDLNHINKTHYF